VGFLAKLADFSMNPRTLFFSLWGFLLLAKLALAYALPPLVDETFYAWEGQHLAWAYSDLPGLSAWLARLGTDTGGQNAFALRLPFLVLGTCVPWLIVRIATRWFGEDRAWHAGIFALLMPLSGLLGVLALPDVPLVLAALLCLDGLAQLRERVGAAGLATLMAGLVVGANTHYRFAGVVLAGAVGLLCDARSRRLLRDARVWAVLVLGALAWLPLLYWNFEHAGMGLRFQLLERNPWRFHGDAAVWIPIQAVLVTPLTFVLLTASWYRCWRSWRADAQGPYGLIFGIGAVSVLGYFVLGFFADSERVSFHWPLAGWLTLAIIAPVFLSEWRHAWRCALFASTAIGLVLALAFLVVAAVPDLRERFAAARFYPADFAGWPDITGHVRDLQLSPGTRIVADNFELAAQLAFALARDDIAVLDNVLNRKHGRAAQLDLWGLRFDRLGRAGHEPLWLIVDDSATPMKRRLAAYHSLCRVFGALPPVETVNADHGRRRFFIARFESGEKKPGCSAPALAWIDGPAPGAELGTQFDVAGWAFKEGVGVESVEVTLDRRPIAAASYGLPMPNVAEYWKISTDPNQPKVGFKAHVDARGVKRGRHWLGLKIRGADGSVEEWPEQPVTIGP
jgi:hypothetical protein